MTKIASQAEIQVTATFSLTEEQMRMLKRQFLIRTNKIAAKVIEATLQRSDAAALEQFFLDLNTQLHIVLGRVDSAKAVLAGEKVATVPHREVEVSR